MNSIPATISSIDGDQLFLSLADGQELRLPVSACEGTVRVGSAVRVFAVTLGGEDAGQTSLARELVNEILRP